MPSVLLTDDPEWARATASCAEALRRPASEAQRVPVLRPTEADIDFVLEAAHAGFRHVVR